MNRSRIAALVLAASLGVSLTFAPVAAFADTSDELQSQLDSANATLSALYAQEEEVAEKVNEIQSELDTTTQEIEKKEEELSAAQDVLANRVNSTYKTGGVSIFTIIFQSTSFEDLISRVYYASKVSASDAEVIQNVKTIKAELSSKKTEQEQLLNEQKTQQEELDAALAESESYINSLSSELQEAIAAEQAAAAAEAEAAAKAAEQAAAANNGNYVDETTADNTTNNTAATTDNTPKTDTDTTKTTTNTNTTTSTTTTTDTSTSGGLTQAQRNAIIAAAWSKVGCAYIYGTTGPSSFDCSGLTQYCYSTAGVSLPRTAAQQGAWGRSTSNPVPGDLVCWGTHVGIYMGNGMMIDAGYRAIGVTYREVYGSPWYKTL